MTLGKFIFSTYFLVCKVGSNIYLLGLVGDLNMLMNASTQYGTGIQ